MPDSDGDSEGNTEFYHLFHFLPDEFLHCAGLIAGHFAEQFIMYLQDEP